MIINGRSLSPFDKSYSELVELMLENSRDGAGIRVEMTRGEKDTIERQHDGRSVRDVLTERIKKWLRSRSLTPNFESAFSSGVFETKSK